MINNLIENLKNFAEQDFPVSDVSSYLKDLKLGTEWLIKYDLRRKNCYTRNLIHKDTDFEVMVICWPPHTSAPIHGHEGEKCWARVESGNLHIGNYQMLSNSPLELNMINELSCDAGYLDGPADIHSVKNISEDFSTSLHIYAKPYEACDIYDLEKGMIERKKIGYYSIGGKIC